MKKIKIIHRRYDCIGCGACVNVAPAYWEMDEEDAKVNLLDSKMKREELYVGDGFEVDRQDLVESGEVCPVNCIEING